MGKTRCKPKPTEAERRACPSPPESVVDARPRLSDIPGPRRPDNCQNCDAQFDLTAWQEHDHDDKPERILVVLCKSCARALIAPHPRLYRQLEENEPWPGWMALCLGCSFRRGLVCTHAKSRDRTLRITQKSPMHLLIGPRRRGRYIWEFAATDCEGLHERNDAA